MWSSEHTPRRNRWSVPALLLGGWLLLTVIVADMADRHATRTAAPASRWSGASPLAATDNAASDRGTDIAALHQSITRADESRLLNEALGSPSPAQRDWLRRHGYAATPEHADLDPSDQAHLHAQAVAGDRDAIDRYAALAAMRGDEDAVAWLQLSAANGSTLSLIRLAHWHAQQPSPENQLTAQAWRLLAMQRGDPLAAFLPEESATAGEVDAIAARADQLHEQLETLRYRQGLAAFIIEPFPTQ
ncbi:MAG TPA: hypothetical protein VFV64_12310 [Permianibacter sp.]|nr:hypothetical protein [Permianibacter sp.]